MRAIRPFVLWVLSVRILQLRALLTIWEQVVQLQRIGSPRVLGKVGRASVSGGSSCTLLE